MAEGVYQYEIAIVVLSTLRLWYPVMHVLYPPYSRVYVSISSPLQTGVGFLDHRPPTGIGWHLLARSTTDKSRGGVPSFRSVVLRCVRRVLSTVRVGVMG